MSTGSSPAPRPRRLVVVMGVSGCGKSTIGALLARRLGCEFVDGDSLHPAFNIAKMARGEPLDDQDRLPWLAAVASQLGQWRAAQVDGVVACSALRRSYRDLLSGDGRRPTFLHLAADRALLRTRIGSRVGHFMPATLLASQLATLEPLAPDELGVTINAHENPKKIITRVCQWLAEHDWRGETVAS